MNFLELFDSRDKKKRLSHIRNLLALALADGSIDKSELDLIIRISVKSGLTPDEMNRILERPDSVKFYPPDNDSDRIEQLYDMVLVMMVDSELHENEIALCKLTALRLGFKHQIIDRMVSDITGIIMKGIALEMALSELLKISEE